ncbi:hypothetical protein JVX92_15010 (plasmid) [Microbacterium hominis]|uniref:hypothetical protein n=1 Tax=Microbacterium hominis TaxID=162426 RepID=UPI00196417C3|nr:hypothetical protein [Microbacterium hominis]QRY42345.1 hypothetical protein JVX92_15010 [Microbacterium hominis]
MAIKKRASVDPARIEAFGAAADMPPDAPAADARTAATPPSDGGWPADLPRTFLLRWPDPELRRELEEVASLEDRTLHKTAVRAMRLGIEALKAQHGA